MNKKTVVAILVLFIFFGAVQFGFSQSVLPEHTFAAGSWEIMEGRLYQNDTEHGLAKVNIRIPQRGVVGYNFNVRIEGGVQDMHGGFGIHVFADSVYPAMSWGCGNSYLLWLNYDANPISSSIPKGLSAQVYRSYSHTYMELMASVDLNQYAYLLQTAPQDTLLPISITINGNTGDVRILNPLNPGSFLTFNLGNSSALQGNWIALRTNGMAASFGLMD